jgi:Tfp pilus assembly protein PilX
MSATDGRRGERGSALIITVLLLTLLLALGTSLLATATIEQAIATNERWSEGAFFAAEAAVQTAIDTLTQGGAPAAIPITDLGDDYWYRSGGADDVGPTAPTLVATTEAEGYSAAAGSGYGSSTTWVMEIYQINATGFGPQSAQREVEVQISVGPLPQ